MGTKDDDGETHEWFAYTSDDRLNFDANDLARSRQRLAQLVTRLRARHRRRGGTVSLAGYSQGARMACEVALAMSVPVRVALFSGFAMLPKFVSAPSGWHGHPDSRLAKAQLRLWIMHGAYDTEISWALARRSYDALREYNPAGIVLERVEVTDDDHWSVWDNEEMASRVLRTFMGGQENAEGEGDDEEESPPSCWNWDDLSDEQQSRAIV